MNVDENPRLKTIPTSKLARLLKEVGPPGSAPWPEIDGCLTALCTARSGSTLLCRQLETLYEIGEMGETLNWSKVKRSSARRIVAARKEPWFSYKIMVANLLALELTGFVDAYIGKTVFLHLIRRDIVAQAVSRAKASQTGQWHADRKPPGNPVYDAGMIADSVRSVALNVEHMRRYIESTWRPHAKILYEDIATNGLVAARTAGDLLGLPRRKLENDSELLRPIERMGDEINEEWKERFLKEMDASIGKIVDAYVASVDFGTTPPWAAAKEASELEIQKKAGKRDRQLNAVLSTFPDETAVLVLAAVEILRRGFPTGSYFIIKKDDALTIRFGAENGVANAILTIESHLGWLKILFNGENPLGDPGEMLKGKEGRKYLEVNEVSDLTGDAVSVLLEQAVRQARTPLPDSGGGRMVIKSKAVRQKRSEKAGSDDANAPE